jgi:hypothetical protein
VVALLSPHAVRRGDPAVPGGEHDSVCLDELAFARFLRPPKPIVPVMAVDCELPLVLARSTFIDGRAWMADEAAYAAGLERLLEALAAEGPATPRTEAGAAPWDFTLYLAEKRRGFSGRNWLFAELDAWLARPGSPAAVILGEPGVGKTAFIAELAHRNPRGLVLAVHCCQADTAATLDPLRFVGHLSASLALALPAYADLLARRRIAPPAPDGGADADRDAGSLLEEAVLAPLAAAGPPPAGLALILVDALDEALGRQGGATILDLIAPRLDRLPPWLRLVLTSRPDRAVLDRLGGIATIPLNARDPRNAADLAGYVEAAIGRLAPEGADGAAASLAASSAGNFLFAREALRGVERGIIPLGQLGRLPGGLAGLYERAFERLFPDAERYAAPRRVLECLIAAREPLAEPSIAAMSGLSAGEVRAARGALGSFLADADGRLAPYHRSLAEWLTEPKAGSRRFAADPAAGRARILRHAARWRETGDAYALAHYPSHLAEAGDGEALDRLITATDFPAVKAAALADRFAPLADFRLLGEVLLASGSEGRLLTLIAGGDALARDGLAGALASAAPDREGVVARVLERLLARPGEGPRLAAIRIAAARGRGDVLLKAARSGGPGVRLRLVPQLHRLWLDDRQAGWGLMDRMIDGLFTIGGWPRLSGVEPLMGWMLAIVASHPDDAAVLLALQGRFRDLALGCRRSLAFRVLGRRWAARPLMGALSLVMARQPDYQPFNLKEIAASMARPPTSRRRAAPLRSILEDPGLDPAGAVEVLVDPAMPFDVHIMLLAERALVAAAGRRPGPTLALLERLWREGRPWLHQSLLYVGFHLIDKAARPVPADWPDRYAALALEEIGATRGTFATDLGAYSMEPHMAWLELVHQHGQAGSGAAARFLPGLLEDAHRLGDAAMAGRVIGAAQILGLAYGRQAAALNALLSAPALAPGPHHGRLVEALANLRLHGERTVDRALDRLGGPGAALAAQVRAAAPTVGAADFPTFLDELATRLLLTSQRFRGELADAFGRAEEARSAAELLRQVLPWAVDLAAGEPILSGPRGRLPTRAGWPAA